MFCDVYENAKNLQRVFHLHNSVVKLSRKHEYGFFNVILNNDMGKDSMNFVLQINITHLHTHPTLDYGI